MRHNQKCSRNQNEIYPYCSCFTELAELILRLTTFDRRIAEHPDSESSELRSFEAEIVYFRYFWNKKNA